MNVPVSIARKRRQLPHVDAAVLLSVLVALLAVAAVTVGDGWALVGVVALAGAGLAVAILLPVVVVRLAVALLEARGRSG